MTEKSIAAIKQWIPLSLAVLFGIITRIPRVPHIQGADGYTLIIEANAFLDGYSSAWLINPLAYFGMTPYSSYPIGSIILLGLFLMIGNSVEIAVNLYVVFFCILSGIATYRLMEYLFDDESTRLFGVIAYQLMPIVYTYTYNMATARAPVLALAPLFILFLLKLNRTGEIRYILYSSAMIPIMMLFHRMAIVYTAFIVTIVILRIMGRFLWKKPITNHNYRPFNRLACVTFLYVIASLFISSIALFGFNPKNVLPDDFLPLPTIGLTPSLVSFTLDYFLFYGPMLFLASLGIFRILAQIWRSRTRFEFSKSNQFVLMVIAAPLVLFLPLPAYSRHILSPFILCLALYGLELTKKHSTRIPVLILLVAPFATFFILYDLFWRDIGIYVIASTAVLSVAFGAGVILNLSHRVPNSIRIFRRNRTRAWFVVVLSILLVVTIVNNDMRNTQDDLIPIHVTDEEIAIANYIKEQKHIYSGGPTILCSHFFIGIRIAAYAGFGSLSDGHGTSILISGYLTGDDVLNASTLDVFGNFFSGVLYDYSLKPHHLWYQIMQGDYNDPIVSDLLHRLNIPFFIGLKGTNNVSYRLGNGFESEFRMTLEAPIVFETETYEVYRLN